MGDVTGLTGNEAAEMVPAEAILPVAGGILFLAIAAWIYFYKLKGKDTAESGWWAAAVIVSLIGLALFVGGLFATVSWLAQPAMVGA